ncbi:ABC-2 type transport system ATP-binding protein [Alicyclobacillus sacchari]|uniref:ABC-2 type transport system ATP-binding protein n=1 Tax=Alicyclobacillus sacchari TaxID=392010 RepID=A0A4R8LTT8_9BACL|nr:ABC transporter ATP-binding protein [Alicyclobacillus sacchari]TDY50016.1 ABC-2 type transport system ATP-binding protein [Alicyclobacillus sacchari]GMA57664.1 ABC transporter ATP-binding protein [Alicyclobacillus sacchari]
MTTTLEHQIEYAVKCLQVGKRYGRSQALCNLSLSLPQGRTIGILGPNGSGKSTLFRLLMGLSQPDSGHIEILGQRPSWQVNRDIAYLPDRARWYVGDTVRDAFRYAQRLLPGFSQHLADNLADVMEISLHMKVDAMSRGQEARLMILLCVAREVPLIILDEPFSGIDLLSRERIIECLIHHMSRREVTMLVSTHELHEAEPLLDHAVFLNRGELIMSGDADELRAHHGSLERIMKTLYA